MDSPRRGWALVLEREQLLHEAAQRIQQWASEHGVGDKDLYEEFLAGRLEWPPELDRLIEDYDAAWWAFVEAKQDWLGKETVGG
jgi:hypothetical protein